MKYTISFLALFLLLNVSAQTPKVLFIGNSYTGQNNFSQIVKDVTTSTGDSIIVATRTLGGATLNVHANDTGTIDKINSNSWDYVVIQAQSQEPSFPIAQVQTNTFPYATILCDSIRANNPCTRPVFFMTWGRENGDNQNCPIWPPVCTYEGMDSLLNLRYRIMGTDNEAYVSPVGAVWHYVRDNYPTIDLYKADGSHPSITGSYLAACTFYTILFQKDPNLITYNHTLTTATADSIKNAVKLVAYDSLSNWNIGTFEPTPGCICSTSVQANQTGILIKSTLGYNQFIFEGALIDYFIEILDANNNLYQDLTTTQSLVEIDITSLPAGQYFIRIRHKTEPYLWMKKILIGM